MQDPVPRRCQVKSWDRPFAALAAILIVAIGFAVGQLTAVLIMLLIVAGLPLLAFASARMRAGSRVRGVI